MGKLDVLRNLKTNRTLVKSEGYAGLEAVRVYLDMLYCRVRFHCEADEYIAYNFMNKKDRYRKNYLNSYWRFTQYKRVRLSDGRFAKKNNQYDFFKGVVGRDYVAVDKVDIETLCRFVENQGKVIFKPNYGSCGNGVFSLNASAGQQGILEAYEKIVGQDYICEGYIVQHPVLAELYPGSVNTLRMLTLNDGKDVKLLATTLRMGCGGNVCDNLSIAGIGASVDLDTGVVFTKGVDFARNTYIYHPDTGAKIIGTEIPHWQKTVETVKSCAAEIPQFAVVGWDIAIAETGPQFVEFNGTSGTKIVQFFDQQPKGKEIIAYIKKNARRIEKQKKRKKNQFKSQN